MKRVNLLFKITDEISSVTVTEVDRFYEIRGLCKGEPILTMIKNSRGNFKLPKPPEYLAYLLQDIEPPKSPFIVGQRCRVKLDDQTFDGTIVGTDIFSCHVNIESELFTKPISVGNEQIKL